MEYSGNPIAILDACVLYPASLRDILLSLADQDLYSPKWSDEIHREWVDNLLKNQNTITAADLQYTINQMSIAFPDANVIGFEALMEDLQLTDNNDKHVLAAAIHCGATVIVTSNLKDFPEDYLAKFGIQAFSPDTFIDHLIHFDPDRSIDALRAQVDRLINPPLTFADVLRTFEKNGLIKSVNAFRLLLELK